MTEVARTSEVTAETAFRDELIDRGLLIPTTVLGIYGRSGVFESIVMGIEDLVTRETAPDRPEVVRYPPVLPRRDVETSGYLDSFPHMTGSVWTLSGGEREAIELGERASRHEDWSEFQEQSESMLVPAACYPVYPWIAAAGPLPDEGRLIDIECYCFRHEPSPDPARMQAFRQRENVRIGSGEQVSDWHSSWIGRGVSILSSLGLAVEPTPASDPFFGRGGKVLAQSQREQALKIELVYPLHSRERPTPIMSINYHLDLFGTAFGISREDGVTAHTACFGFGVERITLALLKEHGLDVESWPTAVRDRLWPSP